MKPHFIREFLTRFRTNRAGTAIGGISSPDRFREILERERARTDRTGVGFSLVVFRLAGRKREAYHTLYHLAELLLARVRTTDEVGWSDKSSLGALLVGAGETGARKFGAAVVASLPKGLSSPALEVYAYPVPSKTGNGNIGEVTESPMDAGPHSPENNVLESSGKPVAEGAGEPLPPVFVRQLPLWKDILDVFLAVLALILLSPLFLLISIYIKVVSPGPVFFKQERIGFRGKKFLCWKFRTMKVDNNAKGHEEYLKSLIHGDDQAMVKLDAKNDPRIIPFGGVLRQSGLDELPQLFNVVLGEMSLVGPRPCLPYEAKEYDRWHSERFDTIPGLTGLWQVSGKNRTTFKEMMRFDIRYSRRMTFWMELQILFGTFPAIWQQIRDHRNKTRATKEAIPIPSEKEEA
jgi:lipopolysaccharide/colanic/teichoic acid biosynthesis glycosyltransferase